MSDGENSPGGASGGTNGPPYSTGGINAATGHLGATGAKLAALWRAQAQFNAALADLDDVPERTREELAQIYVLGMHKELSQLLQRLNWKFHRRQAKPVVNMDNVKDDLADLTKYVICLWQLFDLSADEMLAAVEKKTDALWTAVGTEFRKPEPGQAVIMVDLDNTIAQYTAGLDEWMLMEKRIPVAKYDTYDMAERYNLSRTAYNLLKDEWETGGGYLRLAPYARWIGVIREIRSWEEAFLVVATARPVAESKRVWYDCYAWATQNLGPIDRMLFAERSRVMVIKGYKEGGHPVLVFEDNPAYLPRLAMDAIPTLVHQHPYNEGLFGYPGEAMYLCRDDQAGMVTTGRRMIREQR